MSDDKIQGSAQSSKAAATGGLSFGGGALGVSARILTIHRAFFIGGGYALRRVRTNTVGAKLFHWSRRDQIRQRGVNR